MAFEWYRVNDSGRGGRTGSAHHANPAADFRGSKRDANEKENRESPQNAFGFIHHDYILSLYFLFCIRPALPIGKRPKARGISRFDYRAEDRSSNSFALVGPLKFYYTP